MKRITEAEVFTLKRGTRLVFVDETGNGCRAAVQGEVYKLEGIMPYKTLPTILEARSVKTGTFISAYYKRFALHTPMLEENE